MHPEDVSTLLRLDIEFFVKSCRLFLDHFFDFDDLVQTNVRLLAPPYEPVYHLFLAFDVDFRFFRVVRRRHGPHQPTKTTGLNNEGVG